MKETLETAARRIIRFIRSDDAAHGGLLSKDTIVAADTLEKELMKAARRDAVEPCKADGKTP